ncbi:unnamed protein product, partial [Scytosiphon promiscuus]
LTLDTKTSQVTHFTGCRRAYRSFPPSSPEKAQLRKEASQVLARWKREREGESESGTVPIAECVWFVRLPEEPLTLIIGHRPSARLLLWCFVNEVFQSQSRRCRRSETNRTKSAWTEEELRPLRFQKAQVRWGHAHLR